MPKPSEHYIETTLISIWTSTVVSVTGSVALCREVCIVPPGFDERTEAYNLDALPCEPEPRVGLHYLKLTHYKDHGQVRDLASSMQAYDNLQFPE